MFLIYRINYNVVYGMSDLCSHVYIHSMRTFCRVSERLIKFSVKLSDKFPTFIIQSNDSTSIRECAEKCDVSMTSGCLATGEKTEKRCFFFQKFGVNIFHLNFSL